MQRIVSAPESKPRIRKVAIVCRFRALGFRALGFRALGFRVLGFRV